MSSRIFLAAALVLSMAGDKPGGLAVVASCPREFVIVHIVGSIELELLIAAVGISQWQEHREQQGLEARRQLLEALRVTGEKLDMTYEAVNRRSQTTDPENTGG
jgi:hypothetical protein